MARCKGVYIVCLRNFGNRIKMIYSLLLSGVLLSLLFATSASYCAQLSSLSEFENTISLIMAQMPTNNDNYKALTKLFNSNAWLENKTSLPFGSYDNFILRSHYDTSTKWYIEFLYYDTNNVTFSVNSQYISRSEAFSVKYYRFNIVNLGTTYNPVYQGQQADLTINNNTLSRLVTDTYKFSIFFVDNVFNNAQNYEVWGVNYPILDYYSYNYNSNLSDIDVDDFNTIKQLTINDKLTNIADFGRTSHFSNAYITYWAYRKDLGYFEPYTTIATTSYNIINNDLGEIYFTSDEFLPNTIMQYVLVSNDFENFSSLSILYYCVDSNTVIVNGELDISNTFNNNYYNKYRYDLSNFTNTNSGGLITNASGDTTGFIDLAPITNGIQDIKDTLVDGSQTENIINSYISGDLPDVFGYQENFKTEYNLFWTPLNYLSTQIFNALTLNSTAVFNIPLRNGQTLVLRSSDFTVPDGSLKSFISLYLVFSTVYVVFLSFRRLIDNLNSAGISGVLEKQGVDPDYIKM